MIAPILCLAGAMSLGSMAAANQDIVVVTHTDTGITNVDKIELGRLYLSVSRELGGVTIKAVNQSVEGLKLDFLSALTGMSDRDIESHFVALDMRGEGRWPPEVDDTEALVKLLIKYKKAVGWMTVEEFSELPERARSVLNVLSIDGKTAGEEGYVLNR